MAKAVHLIARLCLKNSLGVRELQAACFVTFILPKACPYVQAVLDVTKQYADKRLRARSRASVKLHQESLMYMLGRRC